MGIKLLGIEYVYPQNKVTNEDLAIEFPDYDFSKFEDKVDIKSRYWVSENETALDLAKKACDKLFNNHSKENIDYILYCTQCPEYFLLTTAYILQDYLKTDKTVEALDYNLGCSGSVYGLNLTLGLKIKNHPMPNLLNHFHVRNTINLLPLQMLV